MILYAAHLHPLPFPILSADPLEDALNVLRQTNASTTSSSRRKRREVLKQLYVNGMLTETRADSSAQVSRQTRSQNVETLPLVRVHMTHHAHSLLSTSCMQYLCMCVMRDLFLTADIICPELLCDPFCQAVPSCLMAAE